MKKFLIAHWWKILLAVSISVTAIILTISLMPDNSIASKKILKQICQYL